MPQGWQQPQPQQQQQQPGWFDQIGSTLGGLAGSVHQFPTLGKRRFGTHPNDWTKYNQAISGEITPQDFNDWITSSNAALPHQFSGTKKSSEPGGYNDIMRVARQGNVDPAVSREALIQQGWESAGRNRYGNAADPQFYTDASGRPMIRWIPNRTGDVVPHPATQLNITGVGPSPNDPYQTSFGRGQGQYPTPQRGPTYSMRTDNIYPNNQDDYDEQAIRNLMRFMREPESRGEVPPMGQTGDPEFDEADRQVEEIMRGGVTYPQPYGPSTPQGPRYVRAPAMTPQTFASQPMGSFQQQSIGLQSLVDQLGSMRGQAGAPMTRELMTEE